MNERIVAASTVLFAVLGCTAGCASEAEATSDPNAKPANCKMTTCDREYEECVDARERSSSSLSCTDCSSICTGAIAASTCMSDCIELCRSTSPSSGSPCGTWRDQCRRTSANRTCLDEPSE